MRTRQGQMCPFGIARFLNRHRAGMPALRFASLCAVICCFPVAAFAASWSPEAVLKQFIYDHYPWQEVDVSSVELSGTPPASAPVSIVVEKSPPGKSVFRLVFREKRTLLASAQVRVFDRVFMSRSSFPRGYVLKEEDLYPTLMETARIPRGALRTAEQAVGNPLLRSIVPNVPLTSTMVSDAPIVKRGRRVVLLVESPGFTIKALGETRQDAAVGSFVKTENVMSKRIATGLLVDENTVRVEY